MSVDALTVICAPFVGSIVRNFEPALYHAELTLFCSTPEVESFRYESELVQAVADPKVDILAFERQKVKGAVRTDFILSAEIIVITLGTVEHVGLAKQATVLATVAVAMTIAVYGLVGAIVKLDDAGLWLRARQGNGLASLQRGLGSAILAFAPRLMKLLGLVGTIAMFLVGGGILAHSSPAPPGWNCC